MTSDLLRTTSTTMAYDFKCPNCNMGQDVEWTTEYGDPYLWEWLGVYCENCDEVFEVSASVTYEVRKRKVK